MRSIRSYLLTRLLAGAALSLAAAGVVGYLLIARSLDRAFDQNLNDRVLGLASLLFQHQEDEVEFEFSDELMPEYERAERPDYFELRYADGRLLEPSNSLRGANLAVPEPAGSEPRHWTAPLPDGRSGRYVSRLIEVHHVYPEEGPDRPQAAHVSIVVARGREGLIAARLAVLGYCAGLALLLMGLLGLLTWIAVARGLAPAARLARALDAVRVDALPNRIDVGALPAELSPVVSTTDALIRRVDAALERERRTAADIAHELRTPISELLTVSEVALRNGLDATGSRKALGTVRDVAWRMGSSVSTLLQLARLEHGGDMRQAVAVDLGAVVRDSLRPLSAAGRERALVIENAVSLGESVECNPEVLHIVVSNLLGNALYYSPRGGRVHCRLERLDAGWRLYVENDAPDLAPEDLHNLSEPFWRKDSARTDRNRAGLGLALSCALAQRTGLELTFELERGRFRAALGASD